MPIRPENKARYPADWKAVSKRILDRAADHCERCGVPNGVMIHRATSSAGDPLWRMADDTAYEDSRCANTGNTVPDTSEDTIDMNRKPVRVVLTVAHLNHTPEDCADENLRAWCQRCHNIYDAPMRRAGTAKRAKADMAIRDMIGGE